MLEVLLEARGIGSFRIVAVWMVEDRMAAQTCRPRATN